MKGCKKVVANWLCLACVALPFVPVWGEELDPWFTILVDASQSMGQGNPSKWDVTMDNLYVNLAAPGKKWDDSKTRVRVYALPVYAPISRAAYLEEEKIYDSADGDPQALLNLQHARKPTGMTLLNSLDNNLGCLQTIIYKDYLANEESGVLVIANSRTILQQGKLDRRFIEFVDAGGGDLPSVIKAQFQKYQEYQRKVIKDKGTGASQLDALKTQIAAANAQVAELQAEVTGGKEAGALQLAALKNQVATANSQVEALQKKLSESCTPELRKQLETQLSQLKDDLAKKMSESSKPAPVQPELVKPEPVQPEPVKPALIKPEPVKLEPAKPKTPGTPPPMGVIIGVVLAVAAVFSAWRFLTWPALWVAVTQRGDEGTAPSRFSMWSSVMALDNLPTRIKLQAVKDDDRWKIRIQAGEDCKLLRGDQTALKLTAAKWSELEPIGDFRLEQQKDAVISVKDSE